MDKDKGMSHISTSRQGRRNTSRLFKHICAFIAGIIVAAIGAAAFIMNGWVIYMMAREESKSLLVFPIFAFLGVVAFLLFALGVKIIRSTIRSMRDHSLDGVDLEKQPWMANAEWRNRRIVHKIVTVPALRVLWILAMGILLGISVYAVMIVPIKILLSAVLISGGIVLGLGYFYRRLMETEVSIDVRNIVALISIVAPILILPFGLKLFSPEINMLLGVSAGVLMVCGFGGIFVYLFLKEKRFGTSICHLKTLPAYVGGALEAEIEIDFPKIRTGLPELPDGPVEADLQNIEYAGRSVIVHWRAKSTVPVHEVIRPGDGTLRIPVKVAIPNEEREKMKRRTFWTGAAWKLEIMAAFPGVDYASWFIVPVYFPEDEAEPLQKTD